MKSQVRIIGGKWRGSKLAVVEARGLRPTPDRIRETLFNWLTPKCSGASVLDCFAGSGVLGFEALSRGAAHVVAQSLAKPRMRAMTAAIMLFSMNLIGYGLGPPIAGLVSDALGGEAALRYSLALMNVVLMWSCVHYFLCARTYRHDLLAKSQSA